MINKEQVIAMILEACPSFQETYNKSDDKDLDYVVMGDLARHLLFLYQNKRTEEFPALCKVIEQLHIEGDNYVKEFATIGILEAIQNNWSHSIDPENFYPFLLPESKKWWKELNDFWSGKIKVVGEGINRANGKTQ